MSPFDATEPHAPFASWFAEAAEREPDVPDAMQVATVHDGVPSIRTVLLKEWGPEGWVFYTNFGSRKGRELDAHPRIAALLHWKSLARQVRVRGTVSRVSDAEADAYFASRPRGSQLGAWASRQSEALEAREILESRLVEVTARFEGQDVPRPAFWGGYRIHIEAMELWQGRDDRLHDRVEFLRDGAGWARRRMYP